MNHAIEPGATTMRLLTPDQYLSTVGDLVGTVPNLASVFADTARPSSLGIGPADLGPTDLQTLQRAGDTVGAAVAGSSTMMNSLAPCAAGANQRTCAQTFVQTFGARAYRTPLTDPTDVERHLQVYDVGAMTSYQHGIELMVSAMLQSPRFLYLVEIGTPTKVASDAVKLSGYEVAARLSYALWNTMPDTKLTAAAAAGTLDTKDGVAAQVSWMLTDPKGQTVVQRFLASWVQLANVDALTKDATMFPTWGSSTLKDSMIGQAQAFFDDVLNNQGGKLTSLLTSAKVVANQDLAGYYGAAVSGSSFQTVQPTGVGPLSGLLTLPALLALQARPDSSSPVYRGKFVREDLFCQYMPPPPPNVPKAPDVMPGVSTRERFKEHESVATCASCHTLIDPIGLGFENYDAVGKYRTVDNGQPVDASGQLTGTDVDGAFDGVPALGQKLAASSEVQDCMATQWFRYMLTRTEGPADGCSISDLGTKFRAAGASLNALPAAMVQTDAFLYRRPLDSQVSP
ncbi:MAG TPA: DUF1592 domain-containing protein [Polyangia bacterium]